MYIKFFLANDFNDVFKEFSPLVDRFSTLLEGGNLPGIEQVKAYAAMQRGVDVDSLNEGQTDEAIDAMQVAVVNHVRKNIIPNATSTKDAFKQLETYNNYTKELRTHFNAEGGIKTQSEITPLPLAYMAGLATEMNKADIVYDPTAGSGSLVMMSNPGRVVANEMTMMRRKELAKLGYTASILDSRNAIGTGRIQREHFDVVVAHKTGVRGN